MLMEWNHCRNKCCGTFLSLLVFLSFGIYIYFNKYEPLYFFILRPRYSELAQLQQYENHVIIPTNRTSKSPGHKPPIILLWTTFFDNIDFGIGLGTDPFRKHCNCTCELITDKNRFSHSSAILVHPRDRIHPFPKKRSPWQRFVLFLLESPIHTPSMEAYGSVFNWTMTYRRDSDIFMPYGRLKRKEDVSQKIVKNYAAGKTKSVLAVYSNCHPPSKRQNYVKHLSQYIQVDVLGDCGTERCPGECDVSRNYTFYLSFENSLCKDYITEKLWENAFQRELVPIVLGGSNYSDILPHHSYIDIADYNSPKELADYLKLVAENDLLYNMYFEWRQIFQVNLTLTRAMTDAFCDLCYKIQTDMQPKVYPDLDGWWRNDVCMKPTDKYKKLVKYFQV